MTGDSLRTLRRLLPAFGWTVVTMAMLAVVILLAGYGQ